MSPLELLTQHSSRLGSRQELYADVWVAWAATAGVASTSATLLTEDDSLAAAVALTVSKSKSTEAEAQLAVTRAVATRC